MKPHLPKKLLVAVLAACSMGLTAKAETAATSYTLGDVMYVGDSITHGVDSSSYRWALHKILVDNGVYYNEVGYQTGHDKGWVPDNNNYTYCGVIFENRHSAQASQRTYNTAGRISASRLGYSSIQNWVGVSTVDSIDPSKTMNGADYTGSVSKPDTFVMLLGTNDLLSDPPMSSDVLAGKLDERTNALLGVADSEGRRTGGDMGTIVDTMYAANPNAVVYISSIPCWTTSGNNNAPETHAAVQTYNASLEKWVADYNAEKGTSIKLVNVNRGLLDVCGGQYGESNVPFYGVSSMFNNADGGTDGLHPNSQGDLIIAGNMARAMGYGGRTAGLARKAAGEASFQTTRTGNLLGEHAWADGATPSGGFTAELMGFTLGNGETDGWNVTDNFSITLGNGSMSGTLDINEAYIQWNGTVSFSTGSTVLFSENMSALTENIRIAYHTGDAANNIASGFYVWLGDMLIGEALQGTESSANGVTLSYSGTGSYTLAALSMDATAAYAPSTSLASSPRVVAPAATAQGVVTVPTVADKDSITIQSAADSSNAMSGVSTTNADTKVATVSFDLTKTLNTYFANNGNRTVKDIYVTINNGQINNGWFAAHTSGTLTGNVTLILAKDYQGIKNFVQSSSGGSIFGVFKGIVDGNVTLQFDAVGASYSTYTSGENAVSVAGAYEGNVSDTLTMVFNAGTFKENVIGGEQNGSGNKIGATKIYVNGGTFAKNLFGGGRVGTIGKDVYANDEKAVSISMTGGSIAAALYGGGRGGEINGDVAVVLTGGSIGGDIYGGGTAGTIKGNTSVTIDGNLVALGGSVISGGGSGGTISGTSTVTIKNASASNYIRSIDQFVGTITGGSNVSDTSTLVFENSVLDSCLFADNVQVEEFDTISLKNSSIGVGSASMTGTTSSISLTGDSTLTVNNAFTSVGELNIEGGSGSVVFAGATNTIGGQLSIAAGNEFVLQTGSALNVKNAIVNDGTLSLNGTVNFQFDSVDGFVYSINPAELNRTNNGLGSAIVEGEFITGSGTLVNTGMVSATINGNAAQINTATGQAMVENAVYYVMAPVAPTVEYPSSMQYITTVTDNVKFYSVVNVGVHEHLVDGPSSTEGANDALQFYVGEEGVLCISSGSNTMSAGEILQTTQGNGTIILRAAGYHEPSENDTQAQAIHFTINDKAQFEGDVYMGPVIYDGSSSIIGQASVHLDLEQGADISSFRTLRQGSSEMYINVNGVIERSSDKVGHINNLSTLGSSSTYLSIGSNANDTLVLGGNTGISSFDYDGDGSATDPTSSTLYVHINKDLHLIVDNLTDGGAGTTYADAAIVFCNGTFNDWDSQAGYQTLIDINSFEYTGSFALNEYIYNGHLHANVTLLQGQQMSQFQYSGYAKAGRYMPTMTIKGSGTYILGEGASILDNIGVLSTEKMGDKQVWSGTVEVNQLVAMDGLEQKDGKYVKKTNKSGIDFADYGNDQSTIHFKGFKGHVFDTVDNNKYLNVTIGQDLILTNPDADTLVKDDKGNPVAPHAFEVAQGYSKQNLNFTGDISGTGDFVVSTGASEKIFFKGDVSEWKDGAEFKVTSGTQEVTFQDAASEINADLVTTTGGTMKATISNTDAVTVNGKVSKAAGGALDLTVSTAAGTTFTNDVNVSSLSVSGGSKATFEQGATAGDVSVGLYKGAAAEVSNGMTIATTTENNITSTSISGGKAVNVDFVFDADKNNTVRNATLEKVSISSVGGSSVLLENLNATNVQLYGKEVNFCALEVENSFYLVSASETHNEIRLESDAFAGMTLTEDGQSMITLTVNNDVNWNDVSNENLNNVTIVLKGFKMEGVGKGEGWLSNLIITGDEDATAASLLTLNAEKSTGTELNVNELLAVDKYDYVTYEQKADGLHIRMGNIPEPSTATLSLLALAALASRRRRK